MDLPGDHSVFGGCQSSLKVLELISGNFKGPRDPLYQLKFWQLMHSCTKKIPFENVCNRIWISRYSLSHLSFPISLVLQQFVCGPRIENGSCDPDHANFRGDLSSIMLGLDIACLYTKFDKSSFSRSRDMIVPSPQKINVSHELHDQLTTPLSGRAQPRLKSWGD